MECPLTSEGSFSTQKTLASLSEDRQNGNKCVVGRVSCGFLHVHGFRGILHQPPEGVGIVANLPCAINGSLLDPWCHLTILRTECSTGIFRVTITPLQGQPGVVLNLGVMTSRKEEAGKELITARTLVLYTMPDPG